MTGYVVAFRTYSSSRPWWLPAEGAARRGWTNELQSARVFPTPAAAHQARAEFLADRGASPQMAEAITVERRPDAEVWPIPAPEPPDGKEGP